MIEQREAVEVALHDLPLRARRLGAETLRRITDWADLHVPACQHGRAWSGVGRELQVASRDATVSASTEGRADCSCQFATASQRRRGRRECCWPGHDGTPAVTRSGVCELGVLLEITTTSASILLGDALDLRHRHPRLWAKVMDAEVPDWQAKRVARLAAELTWEQAREVDAATADLVGDVPWGRASDAVEAAVIRADPELHEARRKDAEGRRYVSAGRYRGTNASGMRTLVAQGPVGDIARIDALVEHLATLLQHHGDVEPLQVRRFKAFGLLANPAQVCAMLAAARDERDAREERLTQAERDAAADAADAATHDAPDAAPAAADSTVDGRDVVPQGDAATDAWDDLDPAEQDAIAPPDPREAAPATAVELAEAFGRVLARHGRGEVWRRLRPRTSLVLHLSESALARSEACRECGAVGDESLVARLEDGRGPLGPVGLEQLRDVVADQLPARLARLLQRAGSSEGTDPRPLSDRIVVRPVLDPMGQEPVDAYDVPPDMREAVEAMSPYEVFPWGTAPSMRCDLDHTEPYRDPPDEAPPPGQTRPDNLGPLSRRHHNLKTHHGWQCFQPLPGLFLWRIPSGYWYRVDHLGTTPLGRSEPEILRQRRTAAPGPGDRSRLEVTMGRVLLEVA
ncbi:HNH endonuclease [Nocardioides sp. HDW12B]|uniref:HNH endonuclease signature motif containing protein n=1 Tax=Nocardioides sp. HDW12B TaxID=2714939 RepID=UPI00140D9453|nr:HNH endonuclease signature motif containing protein [Nocardioides sp. HDW12B]QIK66770.1 HNH endonuclease [Nocardioides sp. HDW12B]